MATKANTVNPCNCPEGYSLIEATGKCQKVESIPPTNNGGNYNICKINPGPYGTGGARFYDNVTTRPLPISANLSISAPGLPAPNLVDSALNVVNYPLTSNASLWQGRMNAAGIWSCVNNQSGNAPNNTGNPALPVGQWVGFSACVNITETKTYCVAIAADNRARFKLNGTLIAQLNPTSSSTYTFIYLHVIPITLQAGLNIITLEGYNDGSQAGFVAEIYDDTPANLAAMTTLSQLTPKIVWSTISQIGAQWQTGNTIGYSCPEGYVLSTCDGLACVKVTTIDKPTCNIKLTPCCKDVDPIIMSSSDLPGISYVNEGQWVCIEDIDPTVGCWQISITTDPVNYSGTVTVGSIYDSCESCESLGCKKCPTTTNIVLKDCCTNLPFTVVDGNIEYVFVLQYDGSYVGDNSPSNLQGLGITHFTASDDSVSYYGCWYIEEISVLPEVSLTYDWKTVMADVETVPTCKDCSCCTPQYKLINCADETDTLIVTGDIAQYIGGVIKIEGCPDICWKVFNDFDCGICQQHVTVLQDFPPTDGYAKVCTYTLPKAPDKPTTVKIVVNGITYSTTYSANIYTLVANLNGLGIGTFTLDELLNIVITSNDTFGPLTIVGQNESVSVNPVCLSGQLYKCTYAIISQSNTGTGLIKIVIDGVAYVSGTINVFSDPASAIAWLNSLNLGVFTVNITNTIPLEYAIQVTGNHTYGLLTLPKPEGNQNYESNCIELVDPETACTACLPPPAPILPKGLIQRFIKPGYTTPGCDTQYTEKVNCNYADQFYQIMLKDRYGITVCCDPNLEYWEIKKALLDFKANTPKTEDLVPPVMCYCYSIAVSAGDINFKYISCDGNCTITLIKEGESVNVCSQSYPYPVCSDSTTITGYTITASNTECETAQDCNPTTLCQCLNVTGNAKGLNIFEYQDCASKLVKTVSLGLFETVNICSVPDTFVVIENAPVAAIGGSCTSEEDCFTCQCYTITSLGRGAKCSYTACDGTLFVDVLLAKEINICAQVGTVVGDLVSIEALGTACTSDLDCIAPGCNCYNIDASGSVSRVDVTYTDCETGETISALDVALLTACAVTDSVTYTGNPLVSVGQACQKDIDCRPCYCYRIIAISPGTITYTNCDGSQTGNTIGSPTLLHICAKEDTVSVTSGDINIIPLGQDCSLSPCINTCTCYSFTVTNDVGSQVSWYECVSGVLTSSLLVPGVYNICARAMPTSVDAIVFTPGADCTATATCPL